MRIFRYFILMGALALFPSLGYAASVPTSMILKTDFRIWDINPSKIDLFSDYQKSEFAGLNVALKSDDMPLAAGLLTQSDVEGLDSMKIRQYLEARIAPGIFREKTDVTIDLDENDEVVFEGSGLYGRRLDLESATRMMEYALKNDVKYVHLPLVREDPIVTVKSDELRKKGIKELISGGETDFSNSPYNRIININVGLSKFEGHIVKPGEEFVFGTVLGAVDGSTGYKRELVIKGNKTVPEYGGGLCQVSTTAYRAVLAAGFPITDRRNHSYAVSYYKPLGLDATVYPPSVEMKFLNDTENHFVMQSFTLGSIAHYNFYGTKANRDVHMIGPYYSGWRSPPPKKVEYSTNLAPGEVQVLGHANSGVNVTWYRYVTYNDEMEVDEESGYEQNKSFIETIYSKYQARPDYYIIGSEVATADENGS